MGVARGSKTPKRSKPGTWREAAELASAAARAEGASITGTLSGRRADDSGTAATSPQVGSAELATATDQVEQADPLRGMGGDQQPHGGGWPAARRPAGSPGRSWLGRRIQWWRSRPGACLGSRPGSACYGPVGPAGRSQ
jgi:hypothetical protein